MNKLFNESCWTFSMEFTLILFAFDYYFQSITFDIEVIKDWREFLLSNESSSFLCCYFRFLNDFYFWFVFYFISLNTKLDLILNLIQRKITRMNTSVLVILITSINSNKIYLIIKEFSRVELNNSLVKNKFLFEIESISKNFDKISLFHLRISRIFEKF